MAIATDRQNLPDHGPDDQSEVDRSHADRSQTDRSQTDRSQTDRSQTDRSRTDQFWTARFADRTRRSTGELTAILALAGAGDVITFSGGFPAPETFPRQELADIAAELILDDAPIALQYASSEGLQGFRQLMAGRIGRTQGLEPGDGELIITSGSIDALTLIAKTMIDDGDTVLVESPTYLGAIPAFASLGADVKGVRVDDEGLDPGALAGMIAGGLRPKLLYVIPDYQNPTGLSLSLDRRLAVIEICRRHGVLIVEDVAYRELSFDAGAPRSMWSLAPEIVVQVGTFSKTLFPGVRLGWAAAPAQLCAQMVVAKQNSDQCAGAFGQRLAEEHMKRGGYDRQLPMSRALYAHRGERMIAALACHMPEGVTWTLPAGGFFTWVTAPPQVSTVALGDQARAMGVAYVPGAPFYPEVGGRSQLRLSYSRASDSDIETGVARLAQLIRTAIHQQD